MVVGTVFGIVDTVYGSGGVGTLSLVQKGQTSGCSTQYTVCSGIVVYGGGDIVFWCKKVKPVDAVCSGHSGIVIYGGGDIVFGAKRSNRGRSMQWMQWNSGIWWWGHCLWCKKVKPVDSVDTVTQWTQWIQWTQWTQWIQWT